MSDDMILDVGLPVRSEITSPSPSPSPDPYPRRRSTKACIQCRRRKQRCDGMRIPCERCERVGKQCSFLIEPPQRNEEGDKVDPQQAIRRLEEEVASLQNSLASAVVRITRLESSANVFPRFQSASHVKDSTLTHQTRDTDIIQEFDAAILPIASVSPQHASLSQGSNGALFRAPMATLRTLYPSSRPISTTGARRGGQTVFLESMDFADDQAARLDPVMRGIISSQDAQRLFDVFFSACHELAPCSSISTQRLASDVRSRSLLLFTSICLIGARYWAIDDPNQSNLNWLHPRYSELVSIFDEHIYQLILHTSASDFSLEVVQAILLSIQWPALDWSDRGGSDASLSPKSRFNDAYAWIMIGLATRLARHIGLDRWGDVAFTDPHLGEEQLARMRIWLNLVSIDRHLTLTAGLPASLTSPPTHISRAFGSHPSAQTGDLRLAGLAELVSIVQLASVSCGDTSLRSLDGITLKVVNTNLDDWADRWSAILKPTIPTFRQEMPFTALRWYRLALNAIPIGAALGDQPKGRPTRTPAALATGVDAAFGLLWQYTSEAYSERPEREIRRGGPGYNLNFTALSSFMFAIDAYWITHAYAAVFLVLLYERGCIDANLTPLPFIRIEPPPPVAETSRLHRIISCALSLFEGVCQGAAHHPATQYRTIVNNALATLDQYKVTVDSEPSVGIDEMLNALMDPGQEWAFLKDLGLTV